MPALSTVYLWLRSINVLPFSRKSLFFSNHLLRRGFNLVKLGKVSATPQFTPVDGKRTHYAAGHGAFS